MQCPLDTLYSRNIDRTLYIFEDIGHPVSNTFGHPVIDIHIDTPYLINIHTDAMSIGHPVFEEYGQTRRHTALAEN